MGAKTKGRSVLIVEDLATLSVAYAEQMREAGFHPVVVTTAAAALAALSGEHDFDAVLLDLQLPDADGLDLLRDQPQVLTDHRVIIVTSDSTVSRAVQAMRLGAYDYLVKPVARDRLVAAVTSASASRLGQPAEVIDKRAHGVIAGSRFIGRSPQMDAVYRQIRLVANSCATVLITGETGTGKEICAETIHQHSSRAAKPFVVLNCGAIPENLIESELFGHVKGAFTGAVENREGAARAADGGTLFLDEIGELPLHLQVKLLRFLQNGEVQRIGSSRAETVDVRVVCATNRDPAVQVAQGRLREDLYYRLAVVPIIMPPLRERSGDIAELATAFLTRYAREAGKVFAPLTPQHIAALEAHRWPGNVRELENVIWRATLLNEGPELPLSALTMGLERDDGRTCAAAAQGDGTPHSDALALATLRGLPFGQVERLVIETAIADCGGSVPAAAQALQLSPSTLYRKLKDW